jgi:predicted protein tyrosine phosphatase
MQPRVSEVREMVKILDKEHDNVEDLAKAALQLAFDLTEQRDTYIVLLRDSKLHDIFAFGFYGTKKQAEKGMINDIAPPTPGFDTWGIRKVIKG